MLCEPPLSETENQNAEALIKVIRRFLARSPPQSSPRATGGGGQKRQPHRAPRTEVDSAERLLLGCPVGAPSTLLQQQAAAVARISARARVVRDASIEDARGPVSHYHAKGYPRIRQPHIGDRARVVLSKAVLVAISARVGTGDGRVVVLPQGYRNLLLRVAPARSRTRAASKGRSLPRSKDSDRTRRLRGIGRNRYRGRGARIGAFLRPSSAASHCQPRDQRADQRHIDRDLRFTLPFQSGLALRRII
jgi:hypothetical protein